MVIPRKWFCRLLDRADGTPLAEPALVTEWLKTKTGDLLASDTVEQLVRCALCMRAGHPSLKCPTLATMNKHRAKKEIRPIVIEANRLVVTAKKNPLTLESVNTRIGNVERDLRSKIGTSYFATPAKRQAWLDSIDYNRGRGEASGGLGEGREEKGAADLFRPPACKEGKARQDRGEAERAAERWRRERQWKSGRGRRLGPKASPGSEQEGA